MLQKAVAGLLGIIDHAMVGHFVGYTANAALAGQNLGAGNPERAMHGVAAASRTDEPIAVGTPVARRPPHRSERAELVQLGSCLRY
jgi:Na+-driven multidrug efflux pump